VKLPRAFYDRPTLLVARDMLGKVLVHEVDGERRAGRIVEVEAYIGPEDRANHAARGCTRRTAIMFGAPGYAYVYLIYGMHYCFNAVTEREGYPAAVLVRALEPLAGLAQATSGPGRLCRALGIDGRHNGADLSGDVLYLEDDGYAVADDAIVRTARVGVEFAGAWAERPWRLYIAHSAYVSRPARRRVPPLGPGAPDVRPASRYPLRR
jgi:DNA-3-methyladenine glycosylase